MSELSASIQRYWKAISDVDSLKKDWRYGEKILTMANGKIYKYVAANVR